MRGSLAGGTCCAVLAVYLAESWLVPNSDALQAMQVKACAA